MIQMSSVWIEEVDSRHHRYREILLHSSMNYKFHLDSLLERERKRERKRELMKQLHSSVRDADMQNTLE